MLIKKCIRLISQPSIQALFCQSKRTVLSFPKENKLNLLNWFNWINKLKKINIMVFVVSQVTCESTLLMALPRSLCRCYTGITVLLVFDGSGVPLSSCSGALHRRSVHWQLFYVHHISTILLGGCKTDVPTTSITHHIWPCLFIENLLES